MIKEHKFNGKICPEKITQIGILLRRREIFHVPTVNIVLLNTTSVLDTLLG
jgi:hypothetical protein